MAISDSAFLKIARAEKRIAELDELLKQKRPFGYFVETNTSTGERPPLDRAALDRAPHLDLAVADVYSRGHRLHGGVNQVWRMVTYLDHLTASGIKDGVGSPICVSAE